MFFTKMHVWTFGQVLFKICACKLGVPPNIDLLCGLVLSFLGGLLQVLLAFNLKRLNFKYSRFNDSLMGRF